MIIAGEVANYESLNFMVTYGRGLVCIPVSEDIAENLDFLPMIANNTDSHMTAFTVSVDYKSNSTGTSVKDRLETIKAICCNDSKPSDFRKPGHSFPLIAKKGGVIERNGHTEAAVDLARLAGFKPVGVIVEVLNDDGTMARVPDLIEFCEKYNIKLITIKDLTKFIKSNK